MSTRIQQLLLQGSAGRLEALLNLPDERNGQVALVCHPHPLHGGTMHSHVVYHTARALRERGFVVLRFNFRGVGQSQGCFDEGRGEQDDVRAALRYLEEHFSGAPVQMAGFSFGSVVGTQVAQGEAQVTSSIAIGLPVHERPTAWLADVRKPLAVVQGGGDPFGDPAAVRTLLASTAAPWNLEEIPGAGHFFPEHLEQLRAAVSRAVDWCVEAGIPYGISTG